MRPYQQFNHCSSLLGLKRQHYNNNLTVYNTRSYSDYFSNFKLVCLRPGKASYLSDCGTAKLNEVTFLGHLYKYYYELHNLLVRLTELISFSILNSTYSIFRSNLLRLFNLASGNNIHKALGLQGKFVHHIRVTYTLIN